MGTGTINSRHEEASASPVRGHGASNDHDLFDIQQQTLREISADARHTSMRPHLISSSGLLNGSHGTSHQISPIHGNDYGYNVPNNGLVSPVPPSSHKKNAFFNSGLGTLSSHGSVLIKN